MVQKMTPQQAKELLEFGQRWQLPDTETKRRMILIADRITENKFIYHLSDGYFKTRIIKGLVRQTRLMVGLRPITDEMLMNYIDGLSIFGLYFKHKRKQDEEEINRLVNPAYIEVMEFLSQEQWIDFVIDSEVVEGEIYKNYNMEIPFSFEAIKKHLKRMRIKMVIPSDIGKVKSDFQKYNNELYRVETPIDNNIVKDKDVKRIITSSAKDNEIDYTELIKRIRFDKDEETKKRAKDNLIQLGKADYFTTCNAKEFAAVALIFFQTGWVINTSSFKEWKSIFAKAFNREDSTYKANHLKENMEFMRTKIPFLDKVPIK
jgi:hypothetical protein